MCNMLPISVVINVEVWQSGECDGLENIVVLHSNLFNDLRYVPVPI